ncbi:MAG: hypothetical protein K2P58_14320 [Hyphomonadaceae bacterium]|nr:hypothetical protein [Hyphomonadaceae bacterium]
MTSIRVADMIAIPVASPLARLADQAPWEWTSNAQTIVADLIAACGAGFSIQADIAVHASARVEAGAVIKGSAVIGPGCFIASTALVRGGCWLGANCTLGPGAELKSTFMLDGSKLAHLNFVGDSVLGADVNIEAGAMIANCRNELADKRIRILFGGAYFATGVDKFGALVGDHVRIGANAVIAPGALIPARTIVPRLSLLDQAPPG